MRLSAVLSATVLTVAAIGIRSPVHAAEPVPQTILRIGMIDTLFEGQNPRIAAAQTRILSRLFTQQTNVRCNVTTVAGLDRLAQQIDSGRFQIGVMHGIELAWIKDRYHSLHPLALACINGHKLRALMLVPAKAEFGALSELRGKRLAMPSRSLHHVPLFLGKVANELGVDAETFFTHVPIRGNTEAAIEAVIQGRADVTVVDGAAWAIYCRRKPVRAERLRVLRSSKWFPAAALVYNPTALPPEITEKLRNGLLHAHERPFSRQLLTLWRLRRFSAVPDDYFTLLDDIRRDYPETCKPVVFTTEASDAEEEVDTPR